jgi:DNA repair protein RadA/Sms
MAKPKIQYTCSSCGAKAPQMIGRCPVCGEWGTYQEEVSHDTPTKKGVITRGSTPQRIQDVKAQEEMRIDMQSSELNRVLGGGERGV